MNIKKYKDIIEQILKKDDRLWNKDKTEFNKALLFNLIVEMDETIIGLLLEEDATREKFFIKIKNAYVFKTKEFKFFIEEHKVFNSYTSYANRMGLFDGKDFIMDRNDVVLNFPFKDCVLEGGQSTEEGKDTYFEYDEKVTKTQEKQGWKPASYNEKQDERQEIFYNEILAEDEIDRLYDKKALVNWKRYTKNGEEKVEEIKRDSNGLIRENLIIKGNNFLALKSLESQFTDQIKLIYIDVPFNTSNDSFAYNDKFTHSTWLTFMKNRIEIAKNLLREDGTIFVHCDKNEDAYLKVLLDEIFERDNFITNIAVKSNSISGNKTRFKDKTILKNKDTILVYKKGLEINLNPQYEEKDKWDTHYNAFLEKNGDSYKIKRLKEVLVENEIIDDSQSIKEDFIKKKEFMEFCIEHKDQIYRLVNSIPSDMKSKSLRNKDQVIKYEDTNGETQYALNGNRIAFLSSSVKEIEGEEKLVQLLGDLWKDIDFQNTQNEGGEEVSLPNGKKPEKLLKRIIELTTNKQDIVLDFFMGSATTQAVSMKLNRQFIGIEQMDYIEDISVRRLNNVINGEQGGISDDLDVNWKGGSDFIYCEIAKWNEKAKEEINSCNNLDELKSLFTDLCDKYYLDYNLKVNNFKNKIIEEDEFIKLPLEEQKYMFLTMLDLNQLYVQATEMEDSKFDISEEDQSLTRMFYEEG